MVSIRLSHAPAHWSPNHRGRKWPRPVHKPQVDPKARARRDVCPSDLLLLPLPRNHIAIPAADHPAFQRGLVGTHLVGRGISGPSVTAQWEPSGYTPNV